jgi:hypothetical protein
VAPHLTGELSFEKIEEMRIALCPEASMYSAVLNIAKLWPNPCVWVEARLAAKKSEENTFTLTQMMQRENSGLRSFRVSEYR